MVRHAATSTPRTREAGRAGEGGDSLRITHPLAIVLLAWIGAIKATGSAFSAVALVDVTTSLGLSPAMRGASAGAIALAIAATAVAAGVAADRLGRRRVLMGSFAVAAAADLAVFLFPSGAVYLLGNVVAGVGYGAMATGSYAYVKALAPGRSLGWALGLFGIFTTLVCTVTVLVGGALADDDWRWLFLMLPAMCAVAALLTPRMLPVMPKTGGGPVDVAGLAVLGAGMLLLIGGLTQATSAPGEPVTWAVVVAGAALMTAWVVIERRSRAPSFPVRVFRSRPYLAAVLAGFAGNVTAAMMVLGLSDLLQYVSRDSVLAATMGMQPSYIVGGVGGVVAGGLLAGRWLGTGVSPRLVMAVGALITGTGYALLAPLQHGSPYWAIFPGTITAGVGLAALMTAQGQVIVRAAPPDAYGAVTSSKTSIGQLGSAVGMVLTVVFFDRMTAGGVTRGLEHDGVTAADAHHTLTALESYLTTGHRPGLHDLSDALGHAMASFTQAFRAGMLISAGAMAVVAVCVWLLMARGDGTETE